MNFPPPSNYILLASVIMLTAGILIWIYRSVEPVKQDTRWRWCEGCKSYHMSERIAENTIYETTDSGGNLCGTVATLPSYSTKIRRQWTKPWDAPDIVPSEECPQCAENVCLSTRLETSNQDKGESPNTQRCRPGGL